LFGPAIRAHRRRAVNSDASDTEKGSDTVSKHWLEPIDFLRNLKKSLERTQFSANLYSDASRPWQSG